MNLWSILWIERSEVQRDWIFICEKNHYNMHLYFEFKTQESSTSTAHVYLIRRNFQTLFHRELKQSLWISVDTSVPLYTGCFSCFRSHQGRLINRCLLKKTVCSHIQIIHSHGPGSAARFIGSATNTESSC